MDEPPAPRHPITSCPIGPRVSPVIDYRGARSYIYDVIFNYLTDKCPRDA